VPLNCERYAASIVRSFCFHEIGAPGTNATSGYFEGLQHFPISQPTLPEQTIVHHASSLCFLSTHSACNGRRRKRPSVHDPNASLIQHGTTTLHRVVVSFDAASWYVLHVHPTEFPSCRVVPLQRLSEGQIISLLCLHTPQDEIYRSSHGVSR
jgi:hypothetical protein